MNCWMNWDKLTIMQENSEVEHLLITSLTCMSAESYLHCNCFMHYTVLVQEVDSCWKMAKNQKKKHQTHGDVNAIEKISRARNNLTIMSRVRAITRC